jgi:hypothetical protein
MRGFRRWQDWIGFALAVWISVSPAVFAFTSGGKVVSAAGIVLALVSLITLGHPLSMAQG